MVFAIIAYSQVKPKSQGKTVNKQKVIKKSIAKLTGTFKDTRDGKIYKTVKIGNQTWMAENLAYGKPTKSITKSSIPSICSNNNNENNTKIYGYLYTWGAAKTACPTGWHLPSDEEWTKLTTYLGGEEKAGVKMKSTSGWNDFKGKTGNGTNTSGFAGLPGGYRYYIGSFYGVGEEGVWWSSSEVRTWDAWNRGLHFGVDKVCRGSDGKQDGLSVRCIKDL